MNILGLIVKAIKIDKLNIGSAAHKIMLQSLNHKAFQVQKQSINNIFNFIFFLRALFWIDIDYPDFRNELKFSKYRQGYNFNWLVIYITNELFLKAECA